MKFKFKNHRDKHMSWRLMFFVLLLLSYSCGKEGDYKFVDFSEAMLVEVPQNERVDQATLRVAVAAMVSPKETFIYYRDLLDYIGTRLNYRIQLIQRKTYGEINELLPESCTKST